MSVKYDIFFLLSRYFHVSKNVLYIIIHNVEWCRENGVKKRKGKKLGKI